jgi:hypothetical protein
MSLYEILETKEQINHFPRTRRLLMKWFVDLKNKVHSSKSKKFH